MRPHDRATDACVRFRLGEQGFGLPLDQVCEIAAAGRITTVPLAPPVIRGLANLRGRVVTLIDVASIYGRPLPPARFPEDRLALILSGRWEHLGVYVHAPVEVGQHTAMTPPFMTMTAAASSSLAPAMAPVIAPPGESGGAPPAGEFLRAPAPALAAVSNDVVNLISAADLVAFCEARVLEGFRRRS